MISPKTYSFYIFHTLIILQSEKFTRGGDGRGGYWSGLECFLRFKWLLGTKSNNLTLLKLSNKLKLIIN